MQRSAKISQNKERQQRTAKVDQNTAKDSQWGTRWWKAFRNSGTLKANCAELHTCRPTVGYCGLHTHTHTRLTALFPGLSGWAGTRKVKPIWILLKQETVSGSGISWAICKFAPRSRQITTPATHHSVFLQAGCPSCRPTNSVKALKAITVTYTEWNMKILLMWWWFALITISDPLFCEDVLLRSFWGNATVPSECLILMMTTMVTGKRNVIVHTPWSGG